MLTRREIEVLGLLSRGDSNIMIAKALKIGSTTVRTHISNIMEKLGADNRTHAVYLAVQAGILGQIEGEVSALAKAYQTVHHMRLEMERLERQLWGMIS